MVPVYPPGCLQNITIADPTSLDGSGLLDITLIPTRGVTDINVFSKKGLLHMKEMLEGADEEMDEEIVELQKGIGLILLGVEEDDPKEFIDDEEVEEASFRYPGPRPRSKEAAVLMLADACESASRAAVELPSGKIESIVRDLSKERLLDGQFDECNLTLRELHDIEDAIIGRLRSIRHQRLAYPDDQDDSVSPDSSS